jgi:hypothetical protein
MFKFLKELLWDADQPPDHIGIPGLVIMGLFLVFCGIMLFWHEAHKLRPDKSKVSAVQTLAHRPKLFERCVDRRELAFKRQPEVVDHGNDRQSNARRYQSVLDRGCSRFVSQKCSDLFHSNIKTPPTL